MYLMRMLWATDKPRFWLPRAWLWCGMFVDQYFRRMFYVCFIFFFLSLPNFIRSHWFGDGGLAFI